MNSIAIDWRTFARAELATYELQNFDINQEAVLSEFEGRLVSSFNSLNTDEIKKSRYQRFKIGQAENYQEYWLPLDSNRQVLCGIRHMNLDPNMPFISVIPNFSLTSKKDALEIYQQIKSHFEMFNPRFLNFYVNHKIDCDKIGNVTMVATTDLVAKLRPWPQETEIELIPCHDYFDWYEEEYRHFHNQQPELSLIAINEKEIMDESMQAGLLYEARKDDERIGLIAGEKTKFLGKNALYFNDIVVKSGFKGKGYGKAMQRKFIEQYRASFDLVFGTIEQINAPSFHTAKANGRIPIRYESFVAL